MSKRIICIHGINSNLTKKRFCIYLNILKILSYQFVSLEDLLAGNCSSKAVAFTVDDGYLNNITKLMPILEEYKIKATLFLAPGLMGLPADSQELVQNQMYPHEATMSVGDLRCWQKNGHSVGFHTNIHLDLYESNVDLIKNDFIEGMKTLNRLSIYPEYFAYPFGFLPRNREMFEELLKSYHFKNAFTVHWGNLNLNAPFYIQRVCLGDNDPLFWLVLKSIGLVDWYYKIKSINDKNRI